MAETKPRQLPKVSSPASQQQPDKYRSIFERKLLQIENAPSRTALLSVLSARAKQRQVQEEAEAQIPARTSLVRLLSARKEKLAVQEAEAARQKAITNAQKAEADALRAAEELQLKLLAAAQRAEADRKAEQLLDEVNKPIAAPAPAESSEPPDPFAFLGKPAAPIFAKPAQPVKPAAQLAPKAPAPAIFWHRPPADLFHDKAKLGAYIHAYKGKEALNLSYANLSGLHLSGLDLHNALFLASNLLGTNLTNSDLRGANFTQSRLAATAFSSAFLTYRMVQNSHGANSPQADAAQPSRSSGDTHFSGAKLQGATFPSGGAYLLTQEQCKQVRFVD